MLQLKGLQRKGMFMATAYQGNKPYIFLSYAHVDRELADYVVDYLQKYNFNVWFDEGIPSGTRWEEVIADKIASPNCWMMVFLATQNSLVSDWCRNELGFAKEEGKKFINVVIGNPTFPKGFRLSYSSYQFLYEKNFPNREAMLDKLVEDLLYHELNPNKPKDPPKETPKETPKAKAPWVCKNCGSNNSDDDDVCEVCGSSERYVAPKGPLKLISAKGLEFSIVDGTARVDHYKGTDTNVIIPFSITYEGKSYEVTTIGERAFYYCKNLTSITIPNGVTSIGNSAFEDCTSLTSISIPNSVTTIGERAFSRCDNLPSIIIPNSVTTIGVGAFAYCKNLTIYCETKSKPTSWDADWNFSKRPVIWGYGSSSPTEDEVCGSSKPSTDSTTTPKPSPTEGLEYSIVDGTARVDRYKGTDTNVIIPATIIRDGKTYKVTSIGYGAFHVCENLTAVLIPKSVTSIGERAFSYCTSLTSIDVDKNNTHYKSIDGNLYTKDGTTFIQYAIGKTETSFTIPNSVTTIGKEAFYGCRNLTSITIPDSVTSIGNYAFGGYSNLTSIDVDKNNTHYKSIDGNLYSKDGSTLIQYAAGKTETSFTIPNSVTSIGEGAFYWCSSLTSITIPNSVTSIGEGAFHWCSSLTTVTIPNSVTTIGKEAFGDCKKLTSITIPNGVTSIGYGAFSGCNNLTSITIPNSVTSIGGWAFCHCSILTITIPESVTSIGDYAFSHCENLTSITIPNRVTSIGKEAFGGCKNLTIYCEAKSKPIRWHTDWNPDNRHVTWGCESSKLISDNGLKFTVTDGTATVFDHTGTDSKVIIPSAITYNGKTYKVTAIEGWAFCGCSSLTSVSIPKGVKSIGESAFEGCTNLTIYCEAKSKPRKWHIDWNPDNRPVVWGRKIK